jgi:DMSO reductase family type II enzyme heme b subunit
MCRDVEESAMNESYTQNLPLTPSLVRRGHRGVAVFAALLLLASPSFAADAQLSVARAATLPATSYDAAWQKVAATRVPLIPQDMVEPRQLQATTPEVLVRAVSDGNGVAFLLEWTDATPDDMAKPAQFTDACAVQFPAVGAADVPAPQMGEPGRQVEITYWRAAWQATVDGRPDSVAALYPGASVDHYPFEAEPLQKNPAAQQEMAKRYAPARALGNEMAGSRQRAVEDLIAEGPGTLSPAAQQHSSGSGKRTATGWAVVLARPLPAPMAAGKRSQVAFAIWDGARGEVGARKMRSVWVPIAMEGKP